MKILGTKFFGQDSAIFYLDTNKKEIFATNSDRISRIKKDNYDISPVLAKYADKFSSVDVVAYPFNNFAGRDSLLETKGTSYYWLKWQQLLRRITQPKSRHDLRREKSFTEKLVIFLKSLLTPQVFYHQLVRNYFWNRYLNSSLPAGFHFPKIDQYIQETLKRYHIHFSKLSYYDHHLCHAASAYYFSPFAYNHKALVFTLDEQGDECFSKLFLFEKDTWIELAKSTTTKFKINGKLFVTSIAGLYSNFTEAMGLIRSTDEGKVEALAAYGKVDQKLYGKLMGLVTIKNLQFKISLQKHRRLSDIDYLKKLKHFIGEPNFCATIQSWLNDIVVEYLNQVYKKHPMNNLCLAGGAISNIIMNFHIYTRTPFKNIYIAPPMGDEGSAAGSAILSALEAKQNLKWLSQENMPYFGPSFSQQEILNTIRQFDNLEYKFLGSNWWQQAAKSITDNKIIAVFQGKMEFGPRALGNRSVLANAMYVSTKERLNSTIKRRPWYQPFCPSILEEERTRLFEHSFKHKHMATAFMMKKKYWHKLPSAIHVDGTARPQFVEKNDNPNFHKILTAVKKITGFGVVINTSFNLHGRTIVHSPYDALVDFIDCGIDEIYIEGYKLTRKTQ